MPSVLFCLFIWTGPCSFEGVSGLFLLSLFIIEISVLNANSIDPDQTPHSAASDLGLQYLPMSFYGTPGMNRLNLLAGYSQILIQMLGAFLAQSTLFARTCLSVFLELMRYYLIVTDKGLRLIKQGLDMVLFVKVSRSVLTLYNASSLDKMTKSKKVTR